jgi:hypothetical protein
VSELVFVSVGEQASVFECVFALRAMLMCACGLVYVCVNVNEC